MKTMQDFSRALSIAALLHNHPTGDLAPSHADIEMSKEVAHIAKTLGIQLCDHVIVGKDGHAKGLKLV